MVTFLCCFVFLIAGFFVYGKYVEKVYGPDQKRETPAYELRDGVDYVPMPAWRIFLIQFLNIAGLGPIFGAIMGAMFGPVVFLWITFGTIFIGAVHDYFSGMMSERNKGTGLPELIGKYIGPVMKIIMLIVTVALMIMVGTVFTSGPADILNDITHHIIDVRWWMGAIFIYFILSTLYPIDKVIGKIYPLFGFVLLFMAVAIFIAILAHGSDIPEFSKETLRNMHPSSDKLHIFPILFITVACGAVSGFHATQSPLMARCIKSETEGRKIFYGAMVAEGCVALIWAGAAMTFFGSVDGFHGFMAEHGNSASVAVNAIAKGWLGKFGSILVLLGVVAAPITSADTAFRSCRLMLADAFKLDQKSFISRVTLSLPIFILSFILLQVNFDIIWRYFSFVNQSLAAITLWAITVYLKQNHKNYFITLIPAIFMTMVCCTYIMAAPEGFHLSQDVALGIGGAFTILMLDIFLYREKLIKHEDRITHQIDRNNEKIKDYIKENEHLMKQIKKSEK